MMHCRGWVVAEHLLLLHQLLSLPLQVLLLLQAPSLPKLMSSQSLQRLNRWKDGWGVVVGVVGCVGVWVVSWRPRIWWKHWRNSEMVSCFWVMKSTSSYSLSPSSTLSPHSLPKQDPVKPTYFWLSSLPTKLCISGGLSQPSYLWSSFCSSDWTNSWTTSCRLLRVYLQRAICQRRAGLILRALWSLACSYFKRTEVILEEWRCLLQQFLSQSMLQKGYLVHLLLRQTNSLGLPCSHIGLKFNYPLLTLEPSLTLQPLVAAVACC